MAGILVPSGGQPVGRLFTAADLARFPTSLPSGDVDYELDCGSPVIVPAHGHLHGGTQARIGAEFLTQVERPGHGRAFINVGIIVSRSPDTVFAADVGFVGRWKFPLRESAEEYLETMPDLVVEIRERDEAWAYIDRKVSAYFAAGVGMVWVADPETKTIVVHRAGSAPRTYLASDTLAIDELIPGFRLNVAEVFRA